MGAPDIQSALMSELLIDAEVSAANAREQCAQLQNLLDEEKKQHQATAEAKTRAEAELAAIKSQVASHQKEQAAAMKRIEALVRKPQPMAMGEMVFDVQRDAADNIRRIVLVEPTQ